MDIPLRYATAALALIAGAGTSHAQTVYVQDPYYAYDTVVARPPAAVPIERTTTTVTVTERYAPGPLVRERVVVPAPTARVVTTTPVVESYAYAPGYSYAPAPAYAYRPDYVETSTYAYVPRTTYVPNAYAYSPTVETVVTPRRWVYEADNGGRDVAYCRARYRSYDPASQTFLGYDGLRHSCP